MFIREELRGIPRAGNAKDIDWSKVANTLPDKEDKPAPIKISVNELLGKVKPQRKQTTAVQTAEKPALVDSNSKSQNAKLITGVSLAEKVLLPQSAPASRRLIRHLCISLSMTLNYYESNGNFLPASKTSNWAITCFKEKIYYFRSPTSGSVLRDQLVAEETWHRQVHPRGY